MAETNFYRVHPSFPRAHPILFLVAVTASFGLVGLAFLAYWLIEAAGTTFTVSSQRVTLQKWFGLKSDRQEIALGDIGTVSVSQGYLQRKLNVGTIAVAPRKVDGQVITIEGIASPDAVKHLLDKLRA